MCSWIVLQLLGDSLEGGVGEKTKQAADAAAKGCITANPDLARTAMRGFKVCGGSSARAAAAQVYNESASHAIDQAQERSVLHPGGVSHFLQPQHT
jgi:hypothetical protein